MKRLFDRTAGFGDVCLEKFERLPTADTLLRPDVCPGNVAWIDKNTSVNPTLQQIRDNYQLLRDFLIKLDPKLDEELEVDGIEWLSNTVCSKSKRGKLFFIFSHSSLI